MSSKNIPVKLDGSQNLKPLWLGPYIVDKVVGPNAYHLVLLSNMSRLYNVFNVKLLKVYKGSIVPPLDPIELDNELEYKVSYFLRHCRHGSNKCLEFLASFVSYDASHN